jgi:hypothetical protein
LLIALAALAGLLLLMARLSAPPSDQAGEPVVEPSPSPAALASPTAAADIVATVNQTTISRAEWQLATRLDAVMSELAYQPVPTVEETLDRMVNEILVLDAVSPITAPTTAEVEARVADLAAAWQITPPAMGSALTEAGLTGSDLNNRIARLIQVETALTRLAGQEADLNAWLLRARASAEIGLYRSLALAAALPPTPTPVAVAPTLFPSGEVSATPVVTAALPVAPYPENLAPPFTLNRLEGGALTLADLRGKPAIINFWATWCPPCQRELPALQAAYEKYTGQIGFCGD